MWLLNLVEGWHSWVLQGFAESLQQDSSNQSEIVMIKLYCCGPGYCSRYPLLYYFFQIRNGLGSSSSVAKILQNPVGLEPNGG